MPDFTRRKALTWTGAAAGMLNLVREAFAGTGPGEEETETWTSLDLTGSKVIEVPVALNGKTVSAMIDSGLSRSVIGKALALELGLPPLGDTAAQSFTKQVNGSIYSASLLELPGMELRNITLECFDTRGLEGVSQYRFPLIIGRDILKRVDIEVDFIRGRARFLFPHRQRSWCDCTVLPLTGASASFPSLTLELEERAPNASMVDSGSDVPVMMSAEYARTSGLLANRRVSTALMFGLEGPITNGAFTVSRIRLGGFDLHKVPIQIADKWNLPEPVSVGWPLFRAFDAVISLGSKRIGLKPDRKLLETDFPKDRLGMFGRREADRLVVLHVAKGSPADVAGIRENDTVTAINGQPISASYPPRTRRLAFEAPGSAIELGLTDGRTLRLILADYF